MSAKVFPKTYGQNLKEQNQKENILINIYEDNTILVKSNWNQKMNEYKITRTTYTKHEIYVEANTEEEAEEVAQQTDLKHWSDMTEERLSEDIEVEIQ